MTPLTSLVGSLLLAGNIEAATPSLELQVLSEQRLELQLCFQGSAQTVSFILHIDSTSPNGQTRSRQQGSLTRSAERQCPVRHISNIDGGKTLKLRLEWTLDGIVQPPISWSAE